MQMPWLKIKYWWERFPLRPNFFGLIILVFIIYQRVFKDSTNANDEFTNVFAPILVLLGNVALLIVLSLAALAIFSTIISFFHFKFHWKKNKNLFQLNIKNPAAKSDFVSINPSLQKAIKPLLGFIGGRLLLKDLRLSNKFKLSKTNFHKHSLKIADQEGKHNLLLPDVKEYEIKGTLLSFEDMFHLLRFTIPVKIEETIYKPPYFIENDTVEQQPLSAHEANVRINQLKTVAGEYLNYKQFEFGDDVRRIVWKIYGKNRDLVVRQIENRNPYASELLIYASFEAQNYIWLQNESFANQLLNYYKNEVWSLYSALNTASEGVLEFIPEQLVNKQFDNKTDKVAYTLANAEWQNNIDLNSYFDTEKGSVFCIHSLTDPNKLLLFLNNGGNRKQIHFTKLSTALKTERRSILARIFLKPIPDKKQKGLNIMLLTKVKSQLIQNEALIKNILKDFNLT